MLKYGTLPLSLQSIYISRITPGGAADKNGALKVGDRLVAVRKTLVHFLLSVCCYFVVMLLSFLFSRLFDCWSDVFGCQAVVLWFSICFCSILNQLSLGFSLLVCCYQSVVIWLSSVVIWLSVCCHLVVGLM